MKPGDEILILILADLGTDHRCCKLATSLKKMGYRPTVLCDRPLNPLGSAWDGIPLRILTRQSHFKGFLKAFLAFMTRATPILLTAKSPVWIVEDGTPLLWTALLGKLLGKQTIYDAREILLETPMIKNRPTRRLAWAIWLGLGTRLVSRILTVSPAFAEYYRKSYPSKSVLLIPNVPRDHAPQTGTLPIRTEAKPMVTSTLRLIYQGALRKDSGLKEVITAVARHSNRAAASPAGLHAPSAERAPSRGEVPGLLPSDIKIELSIYGFGPEESELKALIESLGLRDCVFLMGVVPFEALREPIARAHVGLHLLKPSCLSYDLTLSNKIFDYMAGLTPVLLGRTRAHEDFLRAEPVGTSARSLAPEDILAGLATLHAGYPAFVEACRAARARWNWEAFETQLKDFCSTSKWSRSGTTPS